MGCASSGMVHTITGIVQQSDGMVVKVPAVVQTPGRYLSQHIDDRQRHKLDENSDPTPELEREVAENPNDAPALVALANQYWLSGSGPEPVSDLASRAIAADPDNRAAWHLWALAESNPRQRVTRWQQVSARFPNDDLARANVADNAASLAGAEHDHDALDLAIETYEQLLTTAIHKEQRDALDTALRSLHSWRL